MKKITLLLVGILLSLSAQADSNKEWIHFDGSPEGTPVEVIVDTQNSSEQKTYFELIVHGIWLEEIYSEGRIMQKVEIPGMGSFNQTGVPDLPLYRFNLAVPTTAQVSRLVNMDVVDERVFYDLLVSPQPIEGLDDEYGTEDRYVFDSVIYDSQEYFPGQPGFTGEVKTRMGSIPTAKCAVAPCQWNPATGKMTVIHKAHYVFLHDGDPRNFGEISRDRERLAKLSCLNWEIVGIWFPFQWIFYEADYLFIYPRAYAEEMKPLVDLKKAQGYWVTIYHTEDVGPDCDDYRSAIQTWYGLTPESRDHYCLLVGDTDVIPLCTSPDLGTEDYPGGVATDDLYASVNGDDLDEEVYLGRLSVDSETDAEKQVNRIVEYQTMLSIFSDYSQVGLVAHKENAPGKYEGAHESVRTASYSNAPNFQTYYGSAGATDADVSDAINDGLGLIAYRGHGNSSAWTSWNTAVDYYNSADVTALTNNMNPVVWSFACTNSRLDSNDCIAEIWMEQDEYGAISHYGATVASYTSQNHELDRQMFQAVYDQGLTIQAQAIEYGEAQMASIKNWHNAWMYLLLGDPSMKIKTNEPIEWTITIPQFIYTCPGGICELEILVVDQYDIPVPDAIFAVWKEGPYGDEVFTNAYTDASGRAVIQVSPETAGQMLFTLRDNFGNAMMGEVEVLDSETDAGSTAGKFNFQAYPPVSSGGTSLRFGLGLSQNSEVTIYDVSGRAVRSMDVSAGSSSMDWDGRGRDGNRVAAGVYFARIVDEGKAHTTKMMMLK
jgi:hypothetical protein